MNTQKKEVIKKFCELSSEVGEYFGQTHAHDCFCCESLTDRHFQFEDKILEFIRQAVKEKIAREPKI